MQADDYLAGADSFLERAKMPHDPDTNAAAYRAEAQVMAIQAVAAAIDRLAAAVEGLSIT